MTLLTMPSRGCLVDGRFVVSSTGDEWERAAPSDTRHIVTRPRSGSSLLDEAVDSVARAQLRWRAAPLDDRIAVLQQFGAALQLDAELLAQAVTTEIGKPIAEARAEVASLGSKIRQQIDLAPDALRRHDLPDGAGWFDWAPHGVFGVIGPFNFPLSLSHGHIVPALLAGNGVVLKPSESAPLCAELYVGAWMRAATMAGAPAGLVAMVHGGGDVGAALATHPRVNAVAFTGSYAVGTRILANNALHPERLVALELGGKNAAIVCSDADPRIAAREIVRGAFETTGQRCTATSRVIVDESVRDALLSELLREATRWTPGDPLGDGTTMGPLATGSAHARFCGAQREEALRGLRPIVAGGACEGPGTPGWWVRPAIHAVEDIALAQERWTTELFGPELLVANAADDDAAVGLSNQGPYGLAVAVFTSDRARFARIRSRLRAGLVNHNRRTSGADGRLPFGGIGHSGNHRPAGALSLGYCVYPVATLVG